MLHWAIGNRRPPCETSSNGLSWTLALLSAYPEARRRLEAEIDDGLDGREPEAADVARLQWTTAGIREALRLYPPAWTIERNAVGADRIAGIDIPAGSVVTVPPYLIHRHPEFWPDPVGFDPARFHSAEPADQAAVPAPVLIEVRVQAPAGDWAASCPTSIPALRC